MSTFKGVVEEFPEIRIDYFRTIAGRKPPLAAFLSHVHSDHLQGLESLKAPFVYCSPATRELLLHLEKYPHRMNFAKGILESRKQHYKHLKNLLKTIPLNAPTEIELKPELSIRVTLLDANHCAGAVMFLVEDRTKAILYTGDIRSEPWWVNALVRSPVMIPYTHGQKILDRLYLDTTFATKHRLHHEFPTKAIGLKELLEKMSWYSEETIFHFHAWTLGYEEVWIALSHALRSPIHVDKYKSHLYKSLASNKAGVNQSHEGSALFGFVCGNRYQPGCLTEDQSVRLHSCEHGTECHALSSPDTVFITPIIGRSGDGQVIHEVGAGRGNGNMTQIHELELDDIDVIELTKLCSKKIKDPKIRSRTLDFISKALSDTKTISLDSLCFDGSDDEMPLEELIERICELVNDRPRDEGKLSNDLFKNSKRRKLTAAGGQQSLPKSIEFPYSRHSSYGELCDLVKAFQPRDIYPCTTDEDNWSREGSMRHLFGHFCSGDIFAHDEEMALLETQRARLRLFESRRPAEKNKPWSEGSEELLEDREASLANLPGLSSYSEPIANPQNRPPSDLNDVSMDSAPSGINDSRGGLVKTPNGALPSNTGLSRLEFKGLTQSLDGRLSRLKEKTHMRWTSSDAPSVASKTKLQPGVSKFTSKLESMTGGAMFNLQNYDHPDRIPRPVITEEAHTGSDRKHQTMKKCVVRNQDEPIELSSKQSDSTCDEEAADGDFLLSGMREPYNSAKNSQSRTETQLSLSDTAFESQSPQHPEVETGLTKVQYRKEAYKAAKELRGVWSSVDHGEEELEL